MSGNGGWKAGQVADMLRDGDFDANISAVLADDETVGDVMLRLDDQDLGEGGLSELLRQQSSSDMLRDARKSGDVASMSAATGLSDSSVEATGYDMLLDRCKPAAQQILIKGPKGSGKTVLGLDLMRELYAEFDGEMSFFTNVRGPDDHPSVTFGETMSEMLEWVRDTDGEKCVLGDEWSTTMNSHAHPGGDIRQVVSRFINALRKGQGGSTRLIIIGHEHDSDIAAILRTQADLVVEKAGKADEGLAARANLYDGWNDYVQQSKAFTIRGLNDVTSRSKWSTDTNYFAYFEPDLDNPREQIQRGVLVDNWEQFQDDYEDDGGEPELESIKCRGTSKRDGGGQCGNLTDHISGFCGFHRDQWDGETADPRHEDQ
jgi:hypothetical protein